MKTLIDGETVKQVNCFRYLGCLITEDGYCEKRYEVERRLQREHF